MNSLMTRNNKLITLFLLTLPLMGWAQDDMYFVPKKKAKTQQTTTQRSIPVEIVYADDETLDITGSTRDVDEYNRRTPATTTGEAQLVQQADGSFALQVTADDAQKMSANELYTQGYRDGYEDGEDYSLTRRMGRFNYVSVYSSPWYWSVRYDPFYWDDWYWNRPYWGYSGYYGYYGYRPYYSWGWGYSYHRPYHYGYYGHHRPHDAGRPAYPGGGHMGRNTQYRERYSNLRTADRNYVTPRNSSTQRSVRGGGQMAPMGSRGSSYIRGSQSSSSSTVTSSSSRGSSSGSSRSYSGGSSVTSRAGSASVSRGGNAGGGSRSGGGGFSGGGFSGGGSRGGGSRGGRR